MWFASRHPPKPGYNHYYNIHRGSLLIGLFIYLFLQVKIKVNDVSEEGAHKASLRELQRIYVDVDNSHLRSLRTSIEHGILDGARVTLIQGDIGSGKTTLLASFCFFFFFLEIEIEI